MVMTAYTYDDISLVPQLSSVESRSKVNLTAKFTTNYSIRVPLVASPMDTVCDSEMAIAMAEVGGVGIIHRFMTIQTQSKEVSTTHKLMVDGWLYEDWDVRGITNIPIAAAVGATGDYLERAQELVKNGANVILIDVAHGHHTNVKDAIAALKQNLPSHVDIIAGNIATQRAALDLQEWGADALRVGIGGGSLCSTRIKTGFGIPNVTTLEEIAAVATVPIIACGGIRTSGDIAKALAVGANSVILGSLLAGTKEAPGDIIERPTGLYKRYRGAASLETKSIHGQDTRNVEGESTVVPFKGSAKFVVEGLLDGLRSALSYAGAQNLLKYHPEYVVVTSAGVTEGKPHLL
jgi:IMP dehydrogenase